MNNNQRNIPNIIVILCSLLTMLIFSSNIAFSQDTTKVLFIGNSFTSYNNLPSLFNQLSSDLNKNVVIASHMPGGVSVGDISQGNAAHMQNPYVYSLIRNEKWDYLVLQDNQGRFCLGYGQFPASSLVMEGHKQLMDSLLYYNPCAKVIWFAGFGPKDGFQPYANSGSALIDTIYSNYSFLQDSIGQIIAPIGPAFKRIILNYPNINLWGSDAVHPSIEGSFLIANILYTTIFKDESMNSSFNAGLSISTDSILKEIAYQTTIDSMPFTGLADETPLIIHNGNKLSVNGYSNCEWYLNDTLINSNNCILNILMSGNYYAIVQDSNNCTKRTLTENILYTNMLEFKQESNHLSIFPNPAQNYFQIAGEFQDFQLIIYNSYGKVVLIKNNFSPHQKIYTSELAAGLYFVSIGNESDSFLLKLVIQ